MPSRALPVLLAALVAAPLAAGALAGPARAEPRPPGPPAAEAAGPALPAPEAAPGGPRERYRSLARREAEARGLPAALADAVMRVESGYDASARGAAGEVGLMQVMPPTARLLGFRGTDAELADPGTNVRLGVAYLAGAWRLSGGDVCTAAMKYRAGHGERRFSALSVRYCERVRAHLASVGYPLTGAVPAPTFGFARDVTRMGAAVGSVAAARRLARGVKLRPRVNWAAHDARMRALGARGRAVTGL